MITLIVKDKFDASHQLKDYEGNCSNLHGHTYRIEVYIGIDVINPNIGKNANISIDFKVLKEKIHRSLPDHQHLNELFGNNPTCEIITQHIYKMLKSIEELNIIKVILWETDNFGVEYSED